MGAVYRYYAWGSLDQLRQRSNCTLVPHVGTIVPTPPHGRDGSWWSVDPAEVYVGLLSPLVSLGVGGAGLVPTAASRLRRQTPDLGASIVTIQDAASPAGASWWFVIVDNDSNGVPDGEVADMVMTIVY